MSDDDGGIIPSNLLDVVHDLELGVRVQRRRRLVAQEHRGPLEDGPGYGDPLLLSPRQFQTPLTDDSIVPVWEGINGIMYVGLPCRLQD